jgi:hypothetical protein
MVSEAVDLSDRGGSDAIDTDRGSSEPWEVDYDARVLRAFIVDGRLAAIPAQAKKREVVLRYLLDACFPDDREYPEKEVNQRLALFHRDVAALRRYMVDAGLMTRSAGIYRRTAARSPLPPAA